MKFLMLSAHTSGQNNELRVALSSAGKRRLVWYSGLYLSPIAAENTLSRIEKAILKRLENPESFAVWPSSKERKHPYRRINVKNYTVWYVVIDDVMEVRRILYSGRNEKRLL